MCIGSSPEPQTIVKEKSPTVLRNPYLDEADDDSGVGRTGRNELTISTGRGIGFEGRGGIGQSGAVGLPNNNSRVGAGLAASTLPIRPTPREEPIPQNPRQDPDYGTPGPDYDNDGTPDYVDPDAPFRPRNPRDPRGGNNYSDGNRGGRYGGRDFAN